MLIEVAFGECNRRGEYSVNAMALCCFGNNILDFIWGKRGWAAFGNSGRCPFRGRGITVSDTGLLLLMIHIGNVGNCHRCSIAKCYVTDLVRF